MKRDKGIVLAVQALSLRRPQFSLFDRKTKVFDELPIHKLLESARATRDAAYAPYSNLPVGAAVLTADGQIFTGCKGIIRS